MKLSIKKLFKEFGNHNSPGRPEGPGPHNAHHFHKHPYSAKHGRMYVWGNETWPYEDEDADLEIAIQAAEEGEEAEEEGLPEGDLSLKELFKFTQSASDNTSFMRPPTQGAGAMGAYGKTGKSADTYDPGADNEDEEKEKQKKDVFDGRMKTKAKKEDPIGISVDEILDEVDSLYERMGPQLKNRQERDPALMTTKQPWANGMPGHGPEIEDELAGLDAIDDFLASEHEKEEKTYIKQESRYADTNFSRMAFSKLMRGPKADMAFWEKIDNPNDFLMNSEDDIKKRNRGEDEEEEL